MMPDSLALAVPEEVGEGAGSRCLLCGGADFDELHCAPQRCHMRRCHACGLWVNAAPQPQSEHYEFEYHDQYYGRASWRKARTSASIVRQLSALQPKGRFLDVGCSYGHMLQAAADQGWAAYGVEPSDDMVCRGRERGLNIAQGDLRHLPFDDGLFDVVHARHVLEHELKVYESLAELRRVLAPEGLLAITVPDAGCPKVRRRGAGYARFWKPDHMLGFTRPTLAELLRGAGFAPVPLPAFAGLASGPLAGALPFVIWRLSVLIPEKLGLSCTIISFWRRQPAAPVRPMP